MCNLNLNDLQKELAPKHVRQILGELTGQEPSEELVNEVCEIYIPNIPTLPSPEETKKKIIEIFNDLQK